MTIPKATTEAKVHQTTDVELRALKHQEKEYKVKVYLGLYLLVESVNKPNPKKRWFMRLRQNGKESSSTNGYYPDVSLKAAKTYYDEWLAQRKQGINPIAERKKAKYKVQQEESKLQFTFKVVGDEWLSTRTDLKESTYKARIGLLRNHIYDHIGNIPIDQIRAQDVLSIILQLKSKNQIITARKVRGIASRIFKYGMLKELCDKNPCQNLGEQLKNHKTTPRAAITEPNKIGKLMRDILDYKGASPIVRNAMLLQAYTFCRTNEIRYAEWSDIDLDAAVWRIPGEKMKMGRDHEVPLSQQSIAILKTMKEFNLSTRWVFPNARSEKNALSEKALVRAIRLMGYTDKELCPHGFRAMASTCLNELMYNSDLIEIQLAHVERSSSRRPYNRAKWWQKRCEMMQNWADFLDALRDGMDPAEAEEKYQSK